MNGQDIVFHFLSEHRIEGITSKTPVKTLELILEMLEVNPELTMSEVAKAVDKSLRAVERSERQISKRGAPALCGAHQRGALGGVAVQK